MPRGYSGAFLYTLLAVTFAFFMSLSFLSAADQPAGGSDLTLRNRILTDATAVPLEQARGYVIMEVGTPIPQEVYDALQKYVAIDRYIPPGLYVGYVNNEGTAKKLGAQNLVKRAWPYITPGLLWNVDEPLLEKVEVAEQTGEITLLIQLFPSADEKNVAKALGRKGTVLEAHDHIILLDTTLANVKLVSGTDGVEWVGEVPQHELLNDAAVLVTSVAQERPRHGLYGENEIGALADSGLDNGVNDAFMHDDFKGRIVSITDVSIGASTSPDDESGHGTHVSGTALGDGTMSGSNTEAKAYEGSYAGVAPKAGLVFQAIGSDVGGSSVFPPFPYSSGMFQPAYNLGARFHSDSWGTTSSSFFGVYSTTTQNIDSFVWSNQDMVIVFAAGNNAFFGNTSITPQATAKNILAVGGSENYKPLLEDNRGTADNPNDLYLGTSRGPTVDGRVKPDVMAPATEVFSTRSRVAVPGITGTNATCYKNVSNTPGLWDLGPNYASCTGTSMATPHVAGMALLTREYYRTQRKASSPSAALVKATLINGAMDMGFGTPSNETGWGRVNLSQSLPDVQQMPSDEKRELFFVDEKTGLSTGGKKEYTITASKGRPLKITLVWTDKESALGAAKNLVNDLNLIVTDPDGKVYHGNDFKAPFDDKTDTLNNIEQVRIASSGAGKYTISVVASNVPFPQQTFALVASYTRLSVEVPKVVAGSCAVIIGGPTTCT